MFETTGTINKEILKEVKQYCIPFYFKVILYGLSTLYILSGSISLLHNDISLASKNLLLGISILLVTLIFMKQPDKLILKRYKESYGKEELNVKVYFEENAVIFNNLEIKSIETMNYDIFKKFKETENVFILISKSNQIVLVFKDCLDTTAQYEFKKFISNKCNLKVNL